MRVPAHRLSRAACNPDARRRFPRLYVAIPPCVRRLNTARARQLYRDHRPTMTPSMTHPLLQRAFASHFLRETSHAALIAGLTLIAVTARAEDASALADLSLEELTNMEVSTVARRPQAMTEVAAAVFVVTQDDIRRAGARSIPEALRLAPGVEVAQLNAGKWAISTRGFNSRFANKLLVLKDGRTLHSPSFGGTHWDLQDTMIDDIERIEIIRGPAGTIWGSNAVNGIVNIITKNAAQTSGLLLTTDAGLNDSASVNARYGSQTSNGIDWRVYSKYLERGSNELSDGSDARDGLTQYRAGARADVQLSADDRLEFAVEAYRGRMDDMSSGTVFTPVPPSMGIATRSDMDGFWASSAWEFVTSAGSTFEIRAAFDHADRSEPTIEERRESMDLDVQHVLPSIGRHRLTWGLTTRLNQDYFTPSGTMAILPAEDERWLNSLYAQDEVSFLDHRLAVILGARVEKESSQPTTVLPNLRARFDVTDSAQVWAAIARGERRPVRSEQGGRAVLPPIPAGAPGNPFPLDVYRALVANPEFRAEELTAYELGWRWRYEDRLTTDLSLYYNDYDKLRSMAPPALICNPSGELVATNPMCMFASSSLTMTMMMDNSLAGQVQGGEFILRYTPMSNWRLLASYSYIDSQIDVTAVANGNPLVGQLLTGADPEHQFGLRSSLALGPAWDVDFTLRNVDRLDAAAIPSYTELDARVAWRPTAATELAIVGSNLLNDAHLEAISEFAEILPTWIERSVSLQLRWYLD